MLMNYFRLSIFAYLIILNLMGVGARAFDFEVQDEKALQTLSEFFNVMENLPKKARLF